MDNSTLWKLCALIVVSFSLGSIFSSWLIKNLYLMNSTVKILYLKSYSIRMKNVKDEDIELYNKGIGFIHGALWALSFVGPEEKDVENAKRILDAKFEASSNKNKS